MNASTEPDPGRKRLSNADRETARARYFDLIAIATNVLYERAARDDAALELLRARAAHLVDDAGKV